MPARTIACLAVALAASAAACSSASPGGSPSSTSADTPAGGDDSAGGTATAITPFGLVDPQCVAEVDPTVTVTATDVPPCPTPIVPGQQPGNGGAANNPPVVTVNGWVEYADWTATETPGNMATTWHVPDVPANDVGQTVFYFPSYEPTNGQAIVQPVLQYGVSAAGGGSYWAIASWWVGPGGAARHSSLLQVQPGDTIRGTIKASNCDANGGCKFLIVTRDETLDNARQLTVVESAPYVWVQWGVLEAYGVTDCSQFPPENVTFQSLVLDDQDGTPLSPAWAPESVVPFRTCNYQVTEAPDQSTLLLGTE